MATLTVLGSSDAFNAAGRAHACYLLDDAHGSACIDFGPTAMAALKRLGRDPNQLDGVYLTHLHGDHFGGLQTLLVDAHYRAFRTRPLTIGGPPGTRARIEALFALAYRTIASKPSPFPLEIVEYRPGESRELLGRKLSVFQADHQTPPEEIACVLRVDGGEGAIAFSGDTGWTDALVHASAGADLLVCECTFFTTEVPQHISWTQLAPHVNELGAKQILLTHLSDEMRARAGELAGLPRILIADDGMKLQL